jgi:hypothetical protein
MLKIITYFPGIKHKHSLNKILLIQFKEYLLSFNSTPFVLSFALYESIWSCHGPHIEHYFQQLFNRSLSIVATAYQ